MRSGTTSPCAMAEPNPQVALMSIPPEAVSLKPPPEARASTSGWMSTAMAVSAGERAWFAMPRRAVVVHSAAQQARTAVSNAVSSSMPRKLSNWPAKLLPFLSSIRAEERTALGPSLVFRASCQAASSGARMLGAIGCS